MNVSESPRIKVLQGGFENMHRRSLFRGRDKPPQACGSEGPAHGHQAPEISDGLSKFRRDTRLVRPLREQPQLYTNHKAIMVAKCSISMGQILTKLPRLQSAYNRYCRHYLDNRWRLS
jgi:hypothetical protein